MKLRNVRLQFITHYTERYSYIDSARIALEGGCRWIQLRMKDADETLLEETALIVQKMCKEYDATFIIDDNVHLCKKIKADGVHLGKNDMPIAEARKILGDDFIIGATVNTFDDVLLCQQSTVNGQQTLSMFTSETVVTKNTHGTGCTLSSAIAAFIARGLSLEDAISEAKNYVTEAIRAGADINIGKGIGPVNHFFNPQKMIVL